MISIQATDTTITNLTSAAGGAGNTCTLPVGGGTLATTNNFNNLTYKSTPITITAWSYSGTTTTTITLTVASHTLVVNDFILVNGLTTSTAVSTANNYIIPNGVYQVTAITGTTIQYIIDTTSALTLTPTVSSATVVGQTAVNGVVPNITRSVHNLTTQRAFSTTYYNTSGIEKFITVTGISNNTTISYLTVYINGGIEQNNGLASNSAYFCVSFPVPNGSYFSVVATNQTLDVWSETF